MNIYKFAYISRLIYPDLAANALQTIQMAAAFAHQIGDTHLFVHDLTASEERIRQQYAVQGSSLQIWSLHTQRWPAFIYGHGKARFLTYNSVIAAILGFHFAWRRDSGQRKVLFVRSRLETLYWGLMRPYLWWLRNWVFVCEVHNLEVPRRNESWGTFDYDSSRTKRTVQALQNFDLVLAVTKGLADDIKNLTQNMVKPQVAPLCTGLPRLDSAPIVAPTSGRVVLGYIGTIDLAHGVKDLFHAIELLPENYVLRLVGRVAADARMWLDQRLEGSVQSKKVELVSPVAYSKIAAEIDACDIVLAPAGETIHSNRYRSPLKLFDYMARGKLIVAADVPCHRELLQDGANAIIYKRGDPEDLATRILALTVCPQQAEPIAQLAWHQSANYTYESRAKHILELLNDILEQRRLTD